MVIDSPCAWNSDDENAQLLRFVDLLHKPHALLENESEVNRIREGIFEREKIGWMKTKGESGFDS